jgi:hypothetical protein
MSVQFYYLVVKDQDGLVHGRHTGIDTVSREFYERKTTSMFVDCFSTIYPPTNYPTDLTIRDVTCMRCLLLRMPYEYRSKL